MNFGSLSAVGAFQGGNGVDVVINRGSIVGQVELGSGDDHFDGRGGSIVNQSLSLTGHVEGGQGDDLYLIDDPNIELVELPAQGLDTVGTEVSFTLPDHIEQLSLIGADDINGFGNILDNLITPNIGANFIDGGGGVDTVSYGGSSTGVNAQLYGEFVYNLSSISTLAAAVPRLAATAGSGGAQGDFLVNVENLFGSAFDDFLLGSAQNNLLRGLTGDDLLFGNAGNDVLEGGVGAERLDGGAGVDFAAYATAVSGVTADLIVIANNTGDAAGDFYANIQNLRGSQHDDVLNGTFASNRIEGLDGNDSMRGRGGSDIYVGGNGDDTFIFQNGFAAEQINDFEELNDNEKIDLSQVTAITDFTDLFNNHLSISGSSSVIDDGAGGTITLLNVSVTDLDANDFIF